MKFENKVVVITGAGSGIGRACAAEFAKVQLIKTSGGVAVSVEADVSAPASVQNLVKETIANFSVVHALVNNAAIQVNKTIEDTSFEE